MKVPWMAKESIAANASDLINSFQAEAGCRVAPPVPVEEILERHLQLRLCYEDLEETLGIPDVLGATYVTARKICVNERLFEDSGEGRLVFTAAHEVGHWVLHRRFADEQRRTLRQAETIVCRSRDAKEPIEWQADYFAACLLMPEQPLRDAFERICRAERWVIENVRSTIGPAGRYAEPCVEHWPLIAEALCHAGGFSNVSKHAMIIRLQELGLLVNLSGTAMNWKAMGALRPGRRQKAEGRRQKSEPMA